MTVSAFSHARPSDAAERPAPGFRKLNLGCGPRHDHRFPPPWLNVDSSGDAADVRCDIRRFPAGWTSCFDEVRASHVLEHFYLREMPGVLREWVRVLAPGGTLRVIVPDLRVLLEPLRTGVDMKGRPVHAVDQTTAVMAQLYGVGYDDPEYPAEWRHRFIFNDVTLLALLRSIDGLERVETYDQRDDPCQAFGIWDDSQNPFSLCAMARKREDPRSGSDSAARASGGRP